MKRSIFIFFALGICTAHAQVTSTTDTLISGELMLKQEIVINTNVEKVWRAFTTPEDWKKWVSPVVEIDFKINGLIRSHYNAAAKLGDKGTIVIHIPFYIPQKQIVMQAEIAENFPAFVQEEGKNLYSVYQFDSMEIDKTKITLYGIGYKNDERWQKLLNFFISGNESTLKKLKSYLEKQ